MAGFLDQVEDFIKGINRGATADILGAPVDIINLVLNAVDQTHMLPQRFSTSEPVMGSRWINRRLADAGLGFHEKGTGNENAGRLLGGFSVTPGNIARVGQAADVADDEIRGRSDIEFHEPRY